MATTPKAGKSRTKPAAKKRTSQASKPVPAKTTADRPAAPAAAPATSKLPKTDKASGKVKAKPVRDSFTMPQPDFALIAVLKERAIAFGRPAKKSELLRAGLHALAALNDRALQQALDALTPVKSGRPKKA